VASNSTMNEITLREYLELQISNAQRALEVQAKEYERRLESLNHEAEQLKSMQRTYVQQDTFNSMMSQVDKDLRLLREDRAGQMGQQRVTLIVIGVVVSIVNIAVDVILKLVH